MLLINPKVNPESQPAIVKEFTYASFPTSVAYLAAYLRDKVKDKPVILDEQILDIDEDLLRKEINAIAGPKIAGITCLTVTFKRVKYLINLIRKIDPSVKIILGGIHATALPDDTLKQTGADLVVRGEGELTLAEVYNKFKNETNPDFSNVLGISFPKDGKIIHNPQRPLVENLDDIPPFPFDMFENNIDKYKDFGTIFSSRGCPFDCIFCSQRLISGKRYRFLSNERIMAKIKLLVDKYNQKKIWFIDDNFAINKQRMFSLLDDIIASGYHKKVCFIAQTRGKEITKEALIRLKEANFISIAFGVETASPRIMATLDKNEEVEDNVKAIKMTHEAGIGTDASFIFGLPTETREERMLSLKLAKSLPLDGARFNIAIPYPGTKFHEIAKKEGRIRITEDWSNFSNQHYMEANDIPYAPIGTTRAELIFDALYANLAFSLRLKTLFKMFFKSKLSGGGVISLPKRWYLKPKTVYALTAFALTIMSRVINVIFTIIIETILTKRKNYEKNS